MANYGGFVGGLAAGALNGLAIGKALRGVYDDAEATDIRKKGIADATAAREQIIANQQTPLPAADAQMGPGDELAPAGANVMPAPASEAINRQAAAQGIPGVAPQQGDQTAQWTGVGGKAYADPAQARAAAAKEAPDVATLFATRFSSDLENHLLASGDDKRAAAFREWKKSKVGDETLKLNGKMFQAMQQRNLPAFLAAAERVSKITDDGYDYEDGKFNDDGTVTVKFKPTDGGDSQTVTISPDELVRGALTQYNPATAFEFHMKAIERKQALADKRLEREQGIHDWKLKTDYETAIKEAAESRKAARDEGKEMRMADRKEQADIRAERRALARQAGIDEKDFSKDIEKRAGDVTSALYNERKSEIDQMGKDAAAARKMLADPTLDDASKKAIQKQIDDIGKRQRAIQQEDGAVSRNANAIIAFTRSQKDNPAVRDLQASDYVAMARAENDFDSGKDSPVGLSFGSDGKLYKSYTDPKRGEIQLSPRGQTLDPSNPLHQKAILANNNQGPDGKPLVPAEEFAKIQQGGAAKAANASPAATPAGPRGGISGVGGGKPAAAAARGGIPAAAQAQAADPLAAQISAVRDPTIRQADMQRYAALRQYENQIAELQKVYAAVANTNKGQEYAGQISALQTAVQKLREELGRSYSL